MADLLYLGLAVLLLFTSFGLLKACEILQKPTSGEKS